MPHASALSASRSKFNRECGHPPGPNANLRQAEHSRPATDLPLSLSKEQWLSTSESDEVTAASKLLDFNWRLLACIAGVVVAWLIATQFYIDPSGYVVAFTLATLYGFFGLRNARSDADANPRIFLLLIGLGQMTLAIPVMLTLTYVATSIGLPLQDSRLLEWDRALGFEFRSLLEYVNDHPSLIVVLARSYSSITLQMILLVLVLPLVGCYRRGAEAICAYILAILATTCVSAMVPAIGVYQALGLQASDFPNFEPAGYYDTLRDAPLIRAGLLQKLHLPQLVGVVTFPSFHAAAAVLYVWSFWPLRWLRVATVPWNALMIIATPLGGGHYLVDILAGVAVAALAIVATKSISAACSPRRLAYGPCPTVALSHQQTR